MAANLQQIIEDVRALPPEEQIELIGVVSQFLRRSYQHAVPPTDFWQAKTLDQLVEARATQPVRDIVNLVLEDWPGDEPVDDFITYTYQQRLADRLPA